jgi:cytochrome P450
MPKLLNLGPWGSLAIANPTLLSRWPWRKLRRYMEQSDALLYEEIAERRADPNLAHRTDALAMLVQAHGADGGMSDKELRDQLITLLVAGHDTSATGLSWALERLTRHPQNLAKAVAAAEADDHDYLDAVCKEVLRIRPVVPDVGRVLQEPTDIAGYRLPAGVMVVPSITLVHASDAVYPDADRFDPDRMVGAALSPSTWLPFGGGNRRCLGAGFAMVEMRVVLREILRRVELATTSAPGEKTRLKHVILTPKRGARITVRARRTPQEGHAAVVASSAKPARMEPSAGK